ncbi:hypothetical protein LIPSTDRAFT_71095 [Lipomyces starkeyi NRRL Y-11557]|uniref:Uncharacterized protein n=1 Tax=Lipomyces starkeyi NRRL Y-11557 TaxID=675824 RepID=A0A1E3Q769_LIPST|nr:hypothetical protein LIPSTDRAFT_71095 [Lipomyces starkeyi NRRL Y-11557]
MSAVKQLAVSNTEKDGEEQLQQIEKDFLHRLLLILKRNGGLIGSAGLNFTPENMLTLALV